MGKAPVVNDEPQLEELLSRPSARDVDFARSLDGDVVVLGAGGKMGPSLARHSRTPKQWSGHDKGGSWHHRRFWHLRPARS